MGAEPIFASWNEQARALWPHRPVRMDHTLHRSPLFSEEALAELIEAYPRSHYSLVHMGGRGETRVWREGDIGGLKGRDVIAAIAGGRMWLNLRDVADVAPRYRGALDQMFEEIGANVPGFDGPKRGCGILISSPEAQVYYHADLPGQCLWQILGTKRVYVYPSTPPFITPRHLEDIALFDVEVNVPYVPWYDDHAEAFDLAPGQMLHWPLNAPHRVENLEGVNVSMTVSYGNETIRRAQMVHLANGILRHRFGVTPRSRALSGPSFWGKAVLQKLARDSRWVKRERRVRRAIDFRLDGSRLGEIVDLPAAM
jgi:hypothetical protein